MNALDLVVAGAIPFGTLKSNGYASRAGNGIRKKT
jgi:hypothetical protein